MLSALVEIQIGSRQTDRHSKHRAPILISDFKGRTTIKPNQATFLKIMSEQSALLFS